MTTTQPPKIGSTPKANESGSASILGFDDADFLSIIEDEVSRVGPLPTAPDSNHPPTDQTEARPRPSGPPQSLPAAWLTEIKPSPRPPSAAVSAARTPFPKPPSQAVPAPPTVNRTPFPRPPSQAVPAPPTVNRTPFSKPPRKVVPAAPIAARRPSPKPESQAVPVARVSPQKRAAISLNPVATDPAVPPTKPTAKSTNPSAPAWKNARAPALPKVKSRTYNPSQASAVAAAPLPPRQRVSTPVAPIAPRPPRVHSNALPQATKRIGRSAPESPGRPAQPPSSVSVPRATTTPSTNRRDEAPHPSATVSPPDPPAELVAPAPFPVDPWAAAHPHAATSAPSPSPLQFSSPIPLSTTPHRAPPTASQLQSAAWSAPGAAVDPDPFAPSAVGFTRPAIPASAAATDPYQSDPFARASIGLTQPAIPPATAGVPEPITDPSSDPFAPASVGFTQPAIAPPPDPSAGPDSVTPEPPASGDCAVAPVETSVNTPEFAPTTRSSDDHPHEASLILPESIIFDDSRRKRRWALVIGIAAAAILGFNLSAWLRSPESSKPLDKPHASAASQAQGPLREPQPLVPPNHRVPPTIAPSEPSPPLQPIAVAAPVPSPEPELEHKPPRHRRARHAGHRPSASPAQRSTPSLPSTRPETPTPHRVDPPKPRPTPAPKPSPAPKTKSAATLLNQAESALAKNNDAQAYRLAKRSHNAAPTTAAARVMALAACRQGNTNNAKQAIKMLGLVDRGAVRRDCRHNGIRIGL